MIFFKYPLRTNKHYLQCIAKLRATNKTEVCGVLGESPLTKIFTIPTQIPFDYMHLVLAGHLKWMLSQIFTETSQYSDCYIGK